MTESKRLGKYQILQEIGRGGFSVVYEARDTELDRIVALKVLHPHLTTDPKFIQRFYQEARAAAGLRHPHIVTIHEMGEEAGQHYLAMEFLSGQPLSQLVESGPLTVEQTATILDQIAGALDAVHKQGLVHRDVKPSNIWVNDAGQATLLDFGIVRAAEGTRLTTTMAVLGTPEYMAPEQAEIEEAAGIDWRTDIYALGVVAYEMLVGRPPFIGRSPTAVLHKHIYEPPPAPTALNPGLPAGLEPVLLKALAKRREERFQQAGAFATELRRALLSESQRRMQEAQIAPLYERLQAAAAEEDWAEVLALGGQVRALDPAYRDVPEIMERAKALISRPRRKRLREARPEYRPRKLSLSWVWIVGGVMVVALLTGLIGWRQGWFSSKHPPANASLYDTWTRPTDNMVMVYVPGGEFKMGSTEGDSDEQPVHTVVLDSFWIDRVEVTNGQYQQCVETGSCDPPTKSTSTTRDLYYGNSAYDDYPVIYISWYQADTYCTWARARLPTEAEWEYAARGSDGRTFPWGSSAPNCDKVNYGGCAQDTTRVGSYPTWSSWSDALDMAGNVWEWTADWSGDYPSGRQVNPMGLSSAELRGLRGGSWGGIVSHLRSANRNKQSPNTLWPNSGFRCARDSGSE